MKMKKCRNHKREQKQKSRWKTHKVRKAVAQSREILKSDIPDGEKIKRLKACMEV